MCGDILVIVEVGDSQTVPKVRPHLFPRDGECIHQVGVSLLAQGDRALGLVPRRPCNHSVAVSTQQLPVLVDGITCGRKNTPNVIKTLECYSNMAFKKVQ